MKKRQGLFLRCVFNMDLEEAGECAEQFAASNRLIIGEGEEIELVR